MSLVGTRPPTVDERMVTVVIRVMLIDLRKELRRYF